MRLLKSPRFLKLKIFHSSNLDNLYIHTYARIYMCVYICVYTIYMYVHGNTLA